MIYFLELLSPKGLKMTKLTISMALIASIFTFNACTDDAPKEETKTTQTIMKCEAGKCGEAMLETPTEPMKCEAGKCGANM